MDIPETVESAEPQVDRKELLEQQFEQAEQAAPQVAEARVPRDQAGKFATPDRAVEPPKEEPVWKRPPASWKKDYHDAWQTADPRLQEYAWQREEQMRRGVEPLLTKAQFADSMQEVVAPYLNTIQGLGLKPDTAVKALFEADAALRNPNHDQRLQYFMQLAQQYGVNLSGQAQQYQATDPSVYALQNELNNVRGEVLSWKQQQEARQNETLLGEIDQFSAKAEHFEAARPTMIQLLQSGVAETLQDAYDKAIRLDPELFQTVQQAQQASAAASKSKELNNAAKAARAAAVSVRGSTPGTNTATKAQDRRALLAEQFDGLSDRL